MRVYGMMTASSSTSPEVALPARNGEKFKDMARGEGKALQGCGTVSGRVLFRENGASFSGEPALLFRENRRFFFGRIGASFSGKPTPLPNDLPGKQMTPLESLNLRRKCMEHIR